MCTATAPSRLYSTIPAEARASLDRAEPDLRSHDVRLSLGGHTYSCTSTGTFTAVEGESYYFTYSTRSSYSSTDYPPSYSVFVIARRQGETGLKGPTGPYLHTGHHRGRDTKIRVYRREARVCARRASFRGSRAGAIRGGGVVKVWGFGHKSVIPNTEYRIPLPSTPCIRCSVFGIR